MNPIQEKLIDLVDYVEHMIRLGEKPIFALSEYRQLVFHELELKDKIGIEHDRADENGSLWIKIGRLKRIDPPEIPDDIRDWIKVGRDPFNQPTVHTVRTETILCEEANNYIKQGVLGKKDVQSSLKYLKQDELCDVIFRIENFPEIKKSVENYIAGPWTHWAEEEKPRRETIKIYETFFSFQQSMQTEEVDNPIELVLGIGVVRWKTESHTIDHPLIEQLVEIDIDDNGSINIRPRSTQPELALKPFFSLGNPGADIILNFSKNFFSEFSEDEELSPFQPKTFSPILRQAASQLDKGGQYYPDIIKDITDRSLPSASDFLTITDTWVLYARKRSSNFFINDLEYLKEAIEKCEDLPVPAKKLVTEPSDKVNYSGSPFDLGNATLAGISNPSGGTPVSEFDINSTQTQDFFFPKPFNEDQISIIQNLGNTDGVIVQGPPGTGKTHTIANIICHCLATGKRVLVTSKAEAALTVLRTHIPEGIRELTISLLTNEREGLKQLERAVNLLASTATQTKIRELKEDIIAKQKRILELRNNVKKIDHELREWAKRHLTPFGSTNAIIPMDLAKRVVSGAERHDWLPDRPGPNKKYTPKFTDEDIASAREARKILGNNILYVNAELPSASDLPDTSKLLAIHHDLVNAEHLKQRAADEKTPILSVSVPDAFERAEKLLEAINKVIDFFKAIEDFQWLLNLFNIWKRNGFESDETVLFNNLIPLMEKISDLRTTMIGHAINIPEDAHKNKEFLDSVERAANGQRAFGFLSFGKSEAKSLFQQVKIQGSEPTDIEDWKKIHSYVIWLENISKFITRWDAVSGEFDLPKIEDEGIKTSRKINDIIDNVKKAQDILDSFRELISTEVPKLFPYGMDASSIIKSRKRAETAATTININLSRNRLLRSRNMINNYLNRLSGCSGTISEEIREFLSKDLGDPKAKDTEINNRWQEITHRLIRLHDLKPQMTSVKRVAKLISDSGGTNWAAALLHEPVKGIDDPWTPSNWLESWSWARQDTYLRQIDGRDRIRNLSELRIGYEKELKKKFEQVVRLRTFLGLKKNLSPKVESALVMFTAAIRRIGKGTGIRAQRFRRDARKAMETSYSAVPCWIMPSWRVSESLPAELGSFDLVIVDEASQSDMGALPVLLRGKKLLIVGDDKQVSPTAAFIEEKKLLQLKHNYLKDQPFGSLMLPGISLYDLAAAIFPGERIMLREHFRCVEPIIRFSFQFYDEEIFPLRLPKASERLDPPLIDVYLPHGRKDRRQINVIEAEAIVDEIERITKDSDYIGKSIGVVSLIGAKQSQYIQTLLLARIGEEAFINHKITCGDSATFQGKERHIMFVSMVECSETKSAKTSLLFQQRFNVALSRARDRMYLFRSVTEEMLKPEDLKAKVIRHFKAPMAGAISEVNDLIELCDSGFEEEVFTQLSELGYRVTPQVKVGPYSIDLVVEGTEDRRLAIELDGDKYHTPDRWADDFARQQVLERVGWVFWRCWGSSFILDPEGCMEDLVDTLTSMGIEPVKGDAISSVYTEHRVIEPEKVEEERLQEESVKEMIEPVSVQMNMFSPKPETKEDTIEEVPPTLQKTKSYTTRSESVSVTEEPPTATYHDSFVEVGDKVLISYNDDPSLQYTIRISDIEHDPDMKIIRADMPLARALIDAEINEEIEIPAGGKTRTVTIIKIEKSSNLERKETKKIVEWNGSDQIEKEEKDRPHSFEKIVQLDPDSPEDLTYTKLLEGNVGGKEVSSWNKLVDLVHIIAMNKLDSFDTLKQITKSNIVPGMHKLKGFHPLPELNLSIQGENANKAWQNSLHLARQINIPLKVIFEWRENELAAHPGKKGEIFWSPEI